jgi:hypothetical protein
MIHLTPQGVALDPATGRPWPRLMDTGQTARYLREVWGIPVEPKTLANQRAAGRGPGWQYYGQKPLCRQNEADRYAQEEALTDESPLTRRARIRAEHRQGASPERKVETASST